MRSNRDTSSPLDLTDSDRVSPGSDTAIQRAFMARRALRLATASDPDFPASGTEMVAARLAAARTQRDNELWIQA